MALIELTRGIEGAQENTVEATGRILSQKTVCFMLWASDHRL